MLQAMVVQMMVIMGRYKFMVGSNYVSHSSYGDTDDSNNNVINVFTTATSTISMLG
jgi:hypothetical protein